MQGWDMPQINDDSVSRRVVCSSIWHATIPAMKWKVVNLSITKVWLEKNMGPWICSKDESLVAQTLGHGPSPSVAPGPCGPRGPWGPWTGCVTKPTNGYEASLHRQGNSEAWINHCINWKSAFTSKGFKRLARWRDAFGAYETEQWKLRLIINTILDPK